MKFGKKGNMIILTLTLALLLFISIPTSGQEEEEVEEMNLSTTFYLTSSSGLTLSDTDARGTLQIPSHRLITGGGSGILDTWDSVPVDFPISMGGNTELNFRVRGTMNDLRLSAVLIISGEEVANARSNGATLVSGTSDLTMSMNVPQTRLEAGDTVSLELSYEASMTRNAELVLGGATHLRTRSGWFPFEMEAHPHEGTLHIHSMVSPAWGPESIISTTASIEFEGETNDHTPTSQEIIEGVINCEWMIDEVPEDDYLIRVTVVDISGNSYIIETEAHLLHDDHLHGGITFSGGNLGLLTIVILGVVGIGYLGGISTLSSFFDERKMRYLLAFAAGVFISTAIFHALPESLEIGGRLSWLFVGLGFASLYAIEHWVIDFIDRRFRKKGHVHGHTHTGIQLHLHHHHSKDHEILTDEDIDPADQVCSHHMENTSEAAFFGVGLHNLIEGIVIATLFMNPDTQAIGLIVIVATVLHKAPCTFSIASLLKMAGNSPRQIKKKVLMVLGMTPVGAVLALVLFMNLSEVFIGFALAFSAGTFLEIGLLDLMPESLKQKKGRWIAVVAIAAGIFLLWMFSLVHIH